MGATARERVTQLVVTWNCQASTSEAIRQAKNVWVSKTMWMTCFGRGEKGVTFDWLFMWTKGEDWNSWFLEPTDRHIGQFWSMVQTTGDVKV
jgi:hypothetical protein